MNLTTNQVQGLMQFPSHIRITTYSDWPYSILVNKNGIIDGEGFAFELFKLLVRKFNFTYTIIPPVEDIIGDQKSGMIKQLYNKEVDLAVAFIPTLSEFRSFCDFSVALDEMDTTFLMKRPGTSSSGSGLLAPFSEKSVDYDFHFTDDRWSNHLFHHFLEDEQTEKFTFLTCMWFVYGALLKQGTTVSPIADSTRLVFATWWIFITILTSFYTANLTAFLTLSKFTLAINSLEELVNYKYPWFLINGRSVQTLLHYNYPEVAALTKSKKWGYGYLFNEYDMPHNKILKYAKDGRVFIADRILAKMVILEDYKNKTIQGMNEEKRCTYVISDTNVLPKKRGFGLPKRSLLKKFINNEMIAAVEGGLVKHFKYKKLPEAQICPLNLKSKERRLKISDLWMTYKVVFTGMSVSVIIFILEFFSRLLRKARKCFSQMLHFWQNQEYRRSCGILGLCKGKFEFWIKMPPPMDLIHKEVSQKTLLDQRS